jgi:hypothetical protein
MNRNDKVELLKDFNTIEVDENRWKWILNHLDCGIIIYLDNDDTTGYFENETDIGSFNFDDYLGIGAESLLKVLGIKCESV